LPVAIAHERAKGETKAWLGEIAVGRIPDDFSIERLRNVLEEAGALARCRELLEAYKEDAVRSLWKLDNPNLKGLLRRVIGKIFNELEIKGWCHEFEARNAASRAPGAEPAA
jgi:hypothetical protein